MPDRLTRRGLVVGPAAGWSALSLAGPRALAAAPTKVGFVYVGPVGDFGWTHGHDVGRQAIEAQFGDKVKTSFVENVSEGPDSERVIRKLASSGHDLIFTTSFGFMNTTIRVAKLFPQVTFAPDRG